MPIRSQRLPMRFEDWELLPYQPGWKYEYWGGCAHITPNHQTAVTVAPVTPRPVTAPCVIRPVRRDDETPLLAVYLAASGGSGSIVNGRQSRRRASASMEPAI